MERVTEAGREVSDDGVVWLLVEPSAGFDAWRDSVDTGPPEPSPTVVAAEAIQQEIDARLAPSSVNSIAEVKAAIRDGLAAAVERLS